MNQRTRTLTDTRTLNTAVWGYALPALLSALVLAEVRTAGDVASVVLFAVGQYWAWRSVRWAMVTSLGLVAGWSLGLGIAALTGLATVVVAGLFTQKPLDANSLTTIVVPAAGAVGGAVCGAIVSLVQLAGGKPLAPGRWLRANVLGAILAGAAFALAFVSTSPLRAAVSVALAAAAGMLWGTLAAREAEPVAAMISPPGQQQ